MIRGDARVLACVITVLIGAVLVVLVVSGSARESLLLIGGLFEIFGLLLVASPEIVRAAAHVNDARRIWWGRLARLTRRLLRQPTTRIVQLASMQIESRGTLTAKLTVRHGGHLESKVRRLSDEVEALRSGLDDLGIELAQSTSSQEATQIAIRDELRKEQRRTAQEIRDDHLGLRIPGVLLIVVGVLLATAGNLV